MGWVIAWNRVRSQSSNGESLGVATDRFGSLIVRVLTFAGVSFVAVRVTRLVGRTVTVESGIGMGPPVQVLVAAAASGTSRIWRVSDARSVSDPPAASVASDHAWFRITLCAGGPTVRYSLER